MKNPADSLRFLLESTLTKMRLRMRAKLIIIFVIINVIPLVLLATMAWRQSWLLGDKLGRRTVELTQSANAAIKKTGEVAVNDSVNALNNRATEDIERMTTDTARLVADFLYGRDEDILYASGMLIAESDRSLTQTAQDTQDAITANLMRTTTQLVASAAVMIALVVLIAIWMASAFTNGIKRLTIGISRFRAGERQFRFNAPIKDELGTLADSFDDMADSLVSSVKVPLAITDMNHIVIYMNDEGLNFAGKGTLDEVVGTSYDDCSIYPADTGHNPINALENGHEAEVLYLPDLRIYVRGSATYLTDKDGRRIGYIIMTTEVTEIVEQQKKAEEQRELLDTIFSSSPDLIWYKDEQGRYLAVNPRFSSIIGCSAMELIGRTIDDIVDADKAECFKKNDNETITQGSPLHREEQMTFADGHSETLDTVRTPIYDMDGALVGILGVSRDVSPRVAIESELRRTQMELENAVLEANRANEHKGEFLARMSHELRTPMNAIIGMTNMVRRKLSETPVDIPEVQSHVSQIDSSSQHLLGMLNDILNISKMDAGKIELSEEDVDLDKLLQTVAGIIKSMCEEKSIHFEASFNVPIPARFTTDPIRLRLVLMNMLGNAVKFTPEFGRVEFRVERLERAEGKALIGFAIRDTGIGIAEDVLPTIFQPFEQGTRQVTKQYGGAGLGLAISQRIVSLFGGDIEVQSAVGKGSTFSFSVWLTECEPKEIKKNDIANVENLFIGKRALLVDDVQINRIIAIDLLGFTGMSIDEAEDGADAVKMFEESRENTYDIIFMDVQMPNMNGNEAASAIRAMDRRDAKTVPIVALTANAFSDDIERSEKHGMNAHLAKPLEADQLIKVTCRLLTYDKENDAHAVSRR